MKHKQLLITIAIFTVFAVTIAVLASWPSAEEAPQERHRTRVIIPAAVDNPGMQSALTEQLITEDSYTLKGILADNEQAVMVLNYDFDKDSIEEQVVIYRNLYDSSSPVFIAFFAYDGRTYRRIWDAPAAATVPGTVSIFTQDLLGDRSTCIIITGMNAQGEHTMTVFQYDPYNDPDSPFTYIAGIQMDGSITIQETERSSAYRQGIARGQPFPIVAFGRDNESDNLLDRIEITFEYNQAGGVYEQSRVSRVPGTQIEQRRLREILSGNPRVFENFINDLWYNVNPDGTIERNQYLYFDPIRREVIFYSDESQQVYSWDHSNSTRLGLYITCQNISVSTLRRNIDIELVSLDSIRVRVNERVSMRIFVGASWDGLYRRVGNLPGASAEEDVLQPFIDAVFDSSMGRLQFRANGEYELSSGGTLTRGRYVFFQAGSSRLLELRPENVNGNNRLVYTITSGYNDFEAGQFSTIVLSRVRLGAAGIHNLHESPVILTRLQGNGH